MSILIKDMEMPECCFYCQFMYARRYCWCNSKIEFNDAEYSELKGRHKDCPLVPVPPHGRLIDVDYADDYAYDELEVANNYLTGWEAARAMQKIYQNAPTIIPADDKPTTVETDYKVESEK